MHIGAFEQLAAILVVSALAALLAVLLRQPILLGLLIAGIALGPGVLGLVRIDESITLLAEVGIALLLFLVGLKLDVRIVARLGPVALVVGLAQIVLTFLLGLGIAAAFGRIGIAAVYLGLALTFSSTVVVVKLLTDVRMIDRLHGRLAVGILVIQDIVVVLAMIALTATAGDGGAIGEFVGVLMRGVVFVLASLVLGRFVATPTMHLLGRQAELLVLGAIAWAVSFGALSTILGFSAEVGAFLAGMTLASTQYREAISGRLTPLRDFLLLFFFIEIGAGIDPASLRAGLPIALTLSAAALVAKPIIVTGLLSLAGHRQKVSLATGITLAQISEFSLILVALGVAQGSVGSDIAGIVTTTALITIAISSQMIARTERLVNRLSSRLPRIERRVAGRADLEDGPPLRPDVIVVGLGRFGSTVVEELLDRGEHVVGVDFDPRAVAEGRLGIPILYGDADDPSLGEQLPLEGSRWVVSTLRSLEANLTLVRSLRLNGYPGAIAVASEDPADCERLRAAGADVTIQPLHVAAAPLVARLDADDARRAAHDDVGRDTAFAEFIVERADDADRPR
jgi:Kef-type K+ transport system membrane component KefB/Trk K+ transport system NAD-binding subunit